MFYGGAAGGGKTDLLIGLAITEHFKSIIFRREYEQVKDIEERCHTIIGEHGRYNGQRKIYKLDSGRRLDFGAVQHEVTKEKWKGRPHDLKAFDEVVDFTESQYRYLIGWNRTERPGQRVRVVSTGNPPTRAEGRWVLDYWGAWLNKNHPNPAVPGELRWYAVINGQDVERPDGNPFELEGRDGIEIVQPKSRTFIPARVTDNRYYMATGYMSVLQGLPEPLRSMLLNGDFLAGVQDDPWQVIPTEWVEMAMARGKQRDKPDLALAAMGVDPSRGGADQTVISKRYGNWFAPLIKHPGRSVPDGPSVAALIIQALEGEPDINIDVIGIGAAVYDAVKAQDIDRVYGINAAAKSRRTDKSGKYGFKNLRAEMYWLFREALDPNTGDDIALPDDPELRADLTAPRFKVTTQGIQIEAKEDIKARIGRSPDSADAVVMAAHQPVTMGFDFL